MYHSHTKISSTHQEQQKLHFPYRPSQVHYSRTGQGENQDPGCHGYLSIGTEPFSPQVWPEAEMRVEETGLLKTRKAVLPSEVRRRERSADEIHRGRSNDTDLAPRYQERSAPNREEVLVGGPGGRQGRWSRKEEYTEHVSRLQATEEMNARARQAQEKALNGLYNQHETSHYPAGIQGFAPALSGRWAPDPAKQISRDITDSGKLRTTTSQEAIHNRQAVPQEARAPRDHSPLDMRVSVAQLRHSYLESATSFQKSEQYVVP